MRFNNLNDWLGWQETLNPVEIELGLERVSSVLKQAGLSQTFGCPLITVAGTNGKGSVVAILEAIALAAGLNVCSYTSPHLFHYNERIKINGEVVNDDLLCEAFNRIDQARLALPGDECPLTYFEFGTLAAIDLFFKQQPDLVILEVGLGGRLDAVNIMDADVSILTSVAIDHVDWLGSDRESIGFEKAGVFRAGKTVVCGEPHPPKSVLELAKKLQCQFVQIGQDYEVTNHVFSQTDSGDVRETWGIKSRFTDFNGLPEPSLIGDFQKANAATAIMALDALVKQGLLLGSEKFAPEISLSEAESRNILLQAIKNGLQNIQISGRFQQIKSNPQVFVDVAHNPQAALALASQLIINATRQQSKTNKTWAIVAMLADKDVESVVSHVNDNIDYWCLAGLDDVARGLSVEDLIERFPAELLTASKQDSGELVSESNENQCRMLMANSVYDACKLVVSKADKNDRIIIFGSFYTVSQAIQFFRQYSFLGNEIF